MHFKVKTCIICIKFKRKQVELILNCDELRFKINEISKKFNIPNNDAKIYLESDSGYNKLIYEKVFIFLKRKFRV